MKATLLLADSAQAVAGKLYILGGGWSVTGPEPCPSAVVIYVQVPWDQANTKHRWKLELLDSDGEPVKFPDENGDHQPFALDGELEVGRPAGLKAGSPLDAPVALNFGPLPLPPGGRFEWRFSIDGHSDEDWRLAFSTRPAPPLAAAA